MDCYLITLSGQGDFEVKLVNKKTWDWIHNKGPVPEYQVVQYQGSRSHVPLPLIEEVRAELSQWTGSSPENDRALLASSDFGPICNGCHYISNMKKALKIIKDNKLILNDTFDGYIY